MKKIGILGSTGSVGKQAINVIENNLDKFEIVFLTAHSNFELLLEQAKKFNPDFICIDYKYKNNFLNVNLGSTKTLFGIEGILELCSNKNVDLILNSIVGYQGLIPTLKIIEAGIDIALSNKESIVQAGHIVIPFAKKNKVNIFPVDSEHSALWQCLIGENHNTIKKIILTASGGPFRTLKENDFCKVTKEQALNHPKWNMGQKISIDSATMMNKGFELIEAKWLFDVDSEKIDIVVHPQSIIHSMIEFCDGSIKAQLSEPDMRVPIQFALSYPDRLNIKDLNFKIDSFSNLTFEAVNLKKFKCVKLAYDAIKLGGSYATVLNVANDLLVDCFLKDKISFDMIPINIEKAMDKHDYIKNPSIEEISDITKWTEKYIEGIIKI